MRWTLKNVPDQKLVQPLSKALSIDRTLSQLLVQRGIRTFDQAKKFFRPSLDDLHDPFLLKGMEVAILRIQRAIADKEKILVYGDYDVDGTTSVSLVASYLKTLTKRIATYIPDRYDEGYGISYKGIDYAASNNFSIVIALDCGIKAIDKIDYASKRNIDFIICDHHTPEKKIPSAVAVLNPKRSDCSYPYEDLCGCGIGFKLIQALATKRGQNIQDLIPYLDLVATAIAADIVPITGENRILTYFGLRLINSNPRTGIKALIHQIDKKVVTLTDVVFMVAPRINAAGRIKHANAAVELLMETNFEKALEFAQVINNYNAQRRILDTQITKEALVQIERDKESERFTTVVFNESWHKGVIGIVAARLMETHHRPTLVFTKANDKFVGSARSVKGFDIYDALRKCSAFIEQFGGHKYAAGLTLKSGSLSAFKNKFEQVVRNTIKKEFLVPEISIDASLDLSEITPKFFRILQQMGPFGPENMKPVFYTSSVRDSGYGKIVGSDKKHLKLDITSRDTPKSYHAIGFGLGSKMHLTNHHFDIVYSLDNNEWNGRTSIQLLLKDLRKPALD